jgi:shikimate dehydrogenase
VSALRVGNRTVDKARRLVERFHARAGGTDLRASSYRELAGGRFDLVINATSASLSDSVPELPDGIFVAGCAAYDMMYGKGLTPFRSWRAAGRVPLADGRYVGDKRLSPSCGAACGP